MNDRLRTELGEQDATIERLERINAALLAACKADLRWFALNTPLGEDSYEMELADRMDERRKSLREAIATAYTSQIGGESSGD